MQLAVDFNEGAMPADQEVRESWLAKTAGALVAWDPVARKARWTVDHPGPINGGTLATAGNLVFQGTASGEIRAYTADAGKQLWSFPAQTGAVAGPMTYAVDGTQYVAVLAGWGGVWDLTAGVLAHKSGAVRNVSRMLVFKLGGTATLPPLTPQTKLVLDPPAPVGTPEQTSEGAYFYNNQCGGCHGDAAVAGALVTDLRTSAAVGNPELWKQIVHDGVMKDKGMVAWSANFTPEQIENIRLYVIKRANEDKALEQAASAKSAAN